MGREQPLQWSALNKKVVKTCNLCHLVQIMPYRNMVCPDCNLASLLFFEEIANLKHFIRLYPEMSTRFRFATANLQEAFESIKTEIIVTVCNSCDLVENLPRNINECPECKSDDRLKLNYLSDFKKFLEDNLERYYDFRIINNQLLKIYDNMEGVAKNV